MSEKQIKELGMKERKRRMLSMYGDTDPFFLTLVQISAGTLASSVEQRVLIRTKKPEPNIFTYGARVGFVGE